MEHNVDNTLSSSSQRILDTNIQPTEQPSSSTDGSKKIQSEQTRDLDPSLSTCKPTVSSMEEKKETEFLHVTDPCSSHSSEKPQSSNPSTSSANKDVSLNPVPEPTEDCKSSNRAKPTPFKEFALNPSDLPLSKEKLAESLSLEEACGFLPYMMKMKRCELKGMEGQLDQISIYLQMALRDVKNICILLENAPKDDPEDISAARVQVQKLMYLLSSSFRIFEKLDQWGKALKEGIQAYSKHTGDYHTSVDILLEYIMEKILEKCRPNDSHFYF